MLDGEIRVKALDLACLAVVGYLSITTGKR